MKSIELVRAERERQVSQEGYTASHDDCETLGQLALMAVVYACPQNLRSFVKDFCMWDGFSCKVSDESDIDGRIRNLTKAGALICAEIDRLERLKESELN